jgi:hydrogenase expression/formation protein HypE
VHGTVNDVCLSGAKPLYLSVGFILEEGFPLKDLQRIVQSMAKAAKEAGVSIVTGDTKVVEKGHGDGVFINTTGIGVLPTHLTLSAERIKPGDKIILNGTLGDHGVAIMSQREGLQFEVDLKSDSVSLNHLVETITDAVPQLHYMRDPTRGGVAAVLNELAQQTGHGMMLYEAAIPVKPAVASACEFLGLDPLNVANEGKLLAFCPPEEAEKLVAAMRQHPLGEQAAIVGEVIEDDQHFVQMKTRFGGSRMIDWLNGEQLPRIC